MFNKKISALLLALVLFIGIGTAALAASKTGGEHSAEEFGNLSSVLLSGGYAADYAGGMLLFSDAENGGCLTLRNTESGRERIISTDSVSYINIIGKNIYYITSDVKEFSIVRMTLNSDRKVLVRSEKKLSNLFVSQNEMFYLKDSTVVRFNMKDGTESDIYTNPQMKAFVPNKDGIYWFKEKDVQNNQPRYGACSVNSYEGTEDENINYDCYLYNIELGKNTQTSLSNAIRTVNAEDEDLSSLALTAKVGEKTIPTAEYPVGSYFTDSGEGCTDHRTGVCGWEYEEYCNCKAFHNGVSLKSVQCFAFARYVYNECFGEIGTTDSKTSSSIGSIPKGSVTEESFKALIRQSKPGAHIRVRYIKADGVTVSTHSMIILDWNESGFSVLESNVDGKCGVGVRQIAYSSYVSNVISVEFFMMPDEYPSGSEEETTKPVVSTPSDTKTETTQTESVTNETQTSVNTDLISQIFDLLLIAAEKFLEFLTVIVNIIASMI